MLTSKSIIETVEKIYGVSIRIQPGSRAKGEAKVPRMMAIKLMRDELCLSLPATGRIFGVCPQSIQYAQSSINAKLKHNKRLREEYEEVRMQALELNRPPMRLVEVKGVQL